ncbi:nucleolin-like [Colias croceus]|uniref:nucleolin-like n=1 Tax=Colias crocea TaxID=72248 RepID=UPI001E281467|nr:nucleolin-like [Colias croceus]
MVAPKRGRGAAQKKAKANEEVSQPEPEPTEAMEATEENNGDAQAEAQEEAPAEEAADQAEGEQEAQNTEEAKPEEPKEEKVESGKLLVENLPSSYLFDYQDKLKELFSKHGEINSVKRGPIIVTELTTTPTLSAIVEFKNKECLEKALTEDGTVLEGNAISVVVESSAETAVLVGVPYEASTEYVKLLFGQCGEIAHIHEFSKTKFKILRVTFHEKASVEKALKLDRELRLNGFLVTVSKYRDDDEQKAHANSNKANKRQHGQQSRNSAAGASAGAAGGAGGAAPPRNNTFRPRGGAAFNARGNFRGGARGRGFAGRGGAFPRGGFAPVNTYLPPQGFMGRPGAFMNDGQRPNKRLRQM